MTRKESYEQLIKHSLIKIQSYYDLVELNNYERFLLTVYFYKKPKKENPEQSYYVNIKVTDNKEDFIIDKKINIQNDIELEKILKKSYNSTARIFDYDEKMETALGVYEGKHLSLLFYKT